MVPYPICMHRNPPQRISGTFILFFNFIPSLRGTEIPTPRNPKYLLFFPYNEENMLASLLGLGPSCKKIRLTGKLGEHMAYQFSSLRPSPHRAHTMSSPTTIKQGLSFIHFQEIKLSILKHIFRVNSEYVKLLNFYCIVFGCHNM